MAKRLKEFPGEHVRDRYPWDEWLDGSAWLLRRGDDYTITTASMRAAASRAATERNKRVRTSAQEDDGAEALAIQAYEL